MSYRDVLAITGYRRFWLGFAASAFGDAMNQTALAWFVYSLT